MAHIFGRDHCGDITISPDPNDKGGGMYFYNHEIFYDEEALLYRVFVEYESYIFMGYKNNNADEYFFGIL